MRHVIVFWPLALLLILVGFSEASAKGLDRLPGYKFDKANITILKGYTVSIDELDLGGLSSFGVIRNVTLKSGNSILRVKIYFTQSESLKASQIVDNIVDDPNLTTAYTYNQQDIKKLGFGEVIFTNMIKVNQVINGTVLFSRHNVVVEITDRSQGAKLDLGPIAKQIDSDIDSKVRVTAKEVDSYRPSIEELSLKKYTVKEFTDHPVTAKTSDPSKFKVKKFYFGNSSVEQTKTGDVMHVTGGPFVDTITLVVVNDHLLYTKKTIKLTITK